MKISVIALSCLLLVIVTTPLQAKDCSNLTFDECITAKAENIGSAKAASEVVIENGEKTLGSALAQVNTGVGDSGGSRGTMADFNPLMQLIADNLVSGSDDSRLGVEFNNLLNNWLGEQLKGKGRSLTGQNYKLALSLGEAELYEPLKSALNDQALSSSLEDGIQASDDLKFEFRFSVQTKTMGRNFNNHAVYMDALSQYISSSVQAEVLQADRDLNSAIDFVTDEQNCKPPPNYEDGSHLTLLKLSSYCNEAAVQEIAKIGEMTAVSELSFQRKYAEAVLDSGFEQFAALVNNQSQLIFSYVNDVRDDLVGPNEQLIEFKYELGGVSVNEMKDECGVVPDLACMKRFYLDNSVAIKRGVRFSIAADYKKKDAYDYSDNGISLMLREEESFVASVGGGMYLDLGIDPRILVGKSRIELVGSYEDVMDDPARNDRAMATLTWSQNTSSGLTVSASVVWANEPEYRGLVDHEFSAKLGLNYKIGSSN